MREQLVSNHWIDEALSYWTELNEIKDDLGKSFENELEPNMTEGVPFQDWECRYCQYYGVCPSNLAEKKKRY
jgi:predicted RecB family nuclease